MGKNHRIFLIKIFFAFLLLAVLPLFVWAVATQRIELRKRAATAEPVQVCWWRVISSGDRFHWPNSCKGNPRSDVACQQISIPLSPDEIVGYNGWVSSGKPVIPGCTGSVPPSTQTYQFDWSTQYAYLHADEITITANGKIFKINPGTKVQLHSDPPDNPDYMTLEVSWTEKNIEMRMYIYFNAETVASGPPYRRWWVNEIRTYNGNTPGDWIYYPKSQLTGIPIMGMGIPFTVETLVLTSQQGGTGEIRFKNLQLQAFLNEAAVIQYLSPTPTPPYGHMATPSSALIPTTNVAPSGCNGACTNNSHCQTGFVCVGNSCKNPVCTAAADCQCPVVTNTPIALAIPTPSTVILNSSPTPILTPAALTFRVRLTGVTGAEANGASLNVKLKLKDGTVLPLDKPLVLHPVGTTGIYEAGATLTNPLPAGTPMRILVKAEKHSQIVFCRASGQTAPCNDTEYITPSTYSFDLTGRPLPPGDLNQDGRVNSEDIKLITNLFNKPSSQQTTQDLKTADDNYSGKVDSLDLSLIFQTLETRYDEQ